MAVNYAVSIMFIYTIFAWVGAQIENKIIYINFFELVGIYKM